MIRLIATDLDRTILMPREPLPAELFPLIRTLKQRGVPFVSCSGRQYDCMRRILLPVADEIGFVSTNGAMCFADGKVVDIHPIPREDVIPICQDILEAGMELMVDTPYSVYAFGEHRDFIDLLVYEVGNTTTVMHNLEELPSTVIKISGYRPKGMEESAAPLIKKWEDRYRATPGGPQWFDITRVGKADGLAAMCRLYGVDAADVMAFGDSFNDESMLDFAGHPYIISTADERMKKPRYTVFDSEVEVLKELLKTRS